MKIRIILLIILLISLGAIYACSGIDKKKIEEAAKSFKGSLVKNESLASYMSDNWTFIYHTYGRCEGSTDGSIENLKQKQIDKKNKN